MRKHGPAAALCLALLSLFVCRAHGPVAAQTAMSPGFVDIVALSGLERPTAVRFSPDGRVFVAEKSGLIKVFDSISDTQASIFADLRTNVHNYWDRGLLGMTLDPGFPARPYVYVLYTYDGTIGGTAPRWGVPGETSDGCPDPPGGTVDGCDVSGRLSRLQASGNVMTGSEKVLVHDWFQQFPAHGVGSLVFGADGALYAAGGDGASWQFADYGQRGNPGGDPPVGIGGVQSPPTAEGGALRSQDIRSAGDPTGLNGTVIRINPDTGAALPDNPMYSSASANARRIVAYGLRNPFRMALRPGTREMWIGDVGWRDWEELNVITDTLSSSVKNFGWPCYEGHSRQPGYDAANLDLCEDLYGRAGAVTAPRFLYQEGVPVVAGEACPAADASVTGLAFYTSGNYPSKYRGALFMADYTRRCIWVMFAGANNAPDPAGIATFVRSAGYPVDLQTGPGGDLFYVDHSRGTIRRIKYSSGNSAPHAVISATPTSGVAPLTVAFDGRASSDTEDAALSYQWDLDGDGAVDDSTSPTPSYRYGTNGTRRITLRVTDTGGLSGTASITIDVGNTAPAAVIDTPVSSLRWRVGQSVSFSGHASDAQQGTLPASALSWALVMNHCSSPTSCHEHVIQEHRGVSSGAFQAPDHPYPSYLSLRLTATDAGGLQHTVARRLDPQTVVLTLQSEPAGLQLGFGSETVVTPATRTVIVGSMNSLSAAGPQPIGGTLYDFVSWSDGGAQTHLVTAGSTAATYLAKYATTSGAASPLSEIVLHAARPTARLGAWRIVADATAAGGARIEHPDAAAPKRETPLASPADYFELTFFAERGRPYRLWLRGRAAADSYDNDSVYVQFSGSVTPEGSPVNRIGTTSAAAVIVEDCRGCGVSGWGWNDNLYAASGLGSPFYFASTGVQTIRVQGREDGVSIDQVVLSATTYFNVRPGLVKRDATLLPERNTGTPDVVRHPAAEAVRRGSWRVVDDASAAGGARVEDPDLGALKIATAKASPASYLELTFNAQAGIPYRIWIRGRAHQDSYDNDSVHVQFSGSVDTAGTPVYRIGTTSSTAVVLEDCRGCTLSGWAWQDNGYGAGALGPAIRFASSGPQTLRIQAREDGISIDQVVISARKYVTASPGSLAGDTTILQRTH